MDEALIRTRTKAIYELDNSSSLHAAHGSLALKKSYQDFLGEPGGQLSLELFHTTFTKREVLL